MFRKDNSSSSLFWVKVSAFDDLSVERTLF